MSSPWPAPATVEPDRLAGRSVWAWVAFGVGLLGGVLVGLFTLAAWFIWEVGCTVLSDGDDCSAVWLWVLIVVALAALVLPIVGIVLAERRSQVVPYVLMLAPAPTWYLVFELTIR